VASRARIGYSHRACFYSGSDPADIATDFIARGVVSGDRCIVLLTKPCRDALAQRLANRGLDIASCTVLDTHQVLAGLSVDGRLDEALATMVVGTAFGAAPTDGKLVRARAVGDLAPTLHASGNAQDAVVLERIIDTLARRFDVSVLCAYSIHGFCNVGNLGPLLRVCAEHSLLEFPLGPWCDEYIKAAPMLQADAGSYELN
jgi:hypothetical protein